MALRWILNHLITACAIGALVFVVIFHHEVGSRLARFAEAMGYGFAVEWAASLADSAEDAMATQKTTPPEPTPEPTPRNTPKPEPELASKIAEKPAAPLEQPTVEPKFSEPPTRAPAPASRPMATALLNGDCAATALTPPGEKIIAEWAAARKQYWEGDLTGATKAYERLIKDNPDIPDLPGELANIHFGQGKVDDAAGLYLEAGLRMIQGPAPLCAQRVANILQAIDQDKAQYLEKRMLSARVAGTSN
ncbi:MAG: hypothetical protein HOH04_02920 [Rhodospirillaceae bacterium]|nr:hypothetical protein [Rhodospirillaceae bacterium]